MTLDEVLSHFRNVKRSGGYHTATCPCHDDRQNSLSIKQQDDGKISIQCYAGCDIGGVLAAVGLTWDDLYPESRNSNGGGFNVVAEYDYTDAAGSLVFQVVRLSPKSFRQRRPDPTAPGGWLWKLDGVTRPLYRLPRVLAAIETNKKIFLVEGEKDVHTLESLGVTATTNAGGASKWHRQYTDTLRPAQLIILPDNDDAGRKHAARVQADLPHALILELPGLGPKQDVTDWVRAGGTREDLIRLVRTALAARDAAPVATAAPETQPFKVLGYDSERFYFLSRRTGQVVALSDRSLRTTASFFRLAPQQYWETEFDKDYTAAAEFLVARACDSGIFRADSQRGRGAWIDQDRIVLHQGDHLVVDGARVDLDKFETGYVYERETPLRIPYSAPLPVGQARQLLELCESFRWEVPLSGLLLAGWIALAPICGALRWRPHIWLTGPSGSGKSWIDTEVIGFLLRGVVLQVQSVTTEAGIRQLLRNDALPVQFDEAELDDQRGQSNIQRVLELARQASSADGGVIAKGSAAGQAQTFQIRSAFCLSSISVGVHRRADETRVTVLPLAAQQRGEGAEQFARVQAIRDRLCTEDFAAGLVARSCTLAKTIRRNAETFAIAVHRVLGSRRAGDQLGALLAGYWSLVSDGEIDLEDAVERTAQLALVDVVPSDDTADEQRCLAHILEQRVRVELERSTVERSIGELLDVVRSDTASYKSGVQPDAAEAILRRHGLRTDGGRGFLVSTSHRAIAASLSGTPWQVGWSTFLKRIPGAQSEQKLVRFGGVPTRATRIPWSVLDVPAQVDEAAPTNIHPLFQSDESSEIEEYAENEALF